MWDSPPELAGRNAFSYSKPNNAKKSSRSGKSTVNKNKKHVMPAMHVKKMTLTAPTNRSPDKNSFCLNVESV